MRARMRLLLGASSLVVAGCAAPLHRSEAFGVAHRENFPEQAAARSPGARGPNMRLDSQEAEVIAESYLRGLSGKAAKAEPEPVVYVAPQRQGAPVPLPPSVPRN